MPKVIFEYGNGEKKEIEAQEGQSLLEVAHQNKIPLEGACEGSLACSTCHVILDKKWYDKIDDPSEAEEDMLDLAFGLTETSRLGCQIIMTEDTDGISVKIPDATRNTIFKSD